MTAAIWADVLHLRCTSCGAEPNAVCTFTVAGRTFKRHIPCLSRLTQKES